MTSKGRGAEHQRRRREWQAHLEVNGPVECRRCHQPVYATDVWDLGHGVALAHGGDGSDSMPEHARCNRRAGQRMTTQAVFGARSSRDW